ncbi:hypothetical protein FXO38_34423 [Capsicum annuum]|nr:hypothetical protein FXO38_34423 [Capsicum annuum]
MANTMVDFVNNNLTQLLMDDKDLITEIEDDEVESLTRELNSVRVFLKDANRSRSSSPSEILKHFVKVFSTVVNQAENLIDQFVIEAKLHQKKTHTKVLRFMLCCEDWGTVAEPDSRLLTMNVGSYYKKKVFDRDKCPQDLEQVGRRIAKQCKGLPLATLVIAGALTGRGKTKSEWEKVHQGVSERITSSDFRKTMRLVQMSYDSLPFNLKVCFLYCGAFPRGSEIPARKIVWLWIAEGLVEAPKEINS